MAIGSQQAEEFKNELKQLSQQMATMNRQCVQDCALPLKEQVKLLEEFYQEVQAFLIRDNHPSILIQRSAASFFEQGEHTLVFQTSERDWQYKHINHLFAHGTCWSPEKRQYLATIFTVGKWLKVNHNTAFEDFLQRVSPGGAAWVLTQALPQADFKQKNKI